MAPALVSVLFDLLATRRRETIAHGWAEVPAWVFPSETGGLWDQDNFERIGRWVISATCHAALVFPQRAFFLTPLDVSGHYPVGKVCARMEEDSPFWVAIFRPPRPPLL